MNYLVTGACGFIGSKLAERLISLGHSVVTVDNLSTGFIENLPSNVELIEGDCFCPKIISKLYDYKFNAIFHIAGQSSGEISYDDPVYDLQTNTQSTVMLLKLARDTDCKKFIYASSMSVYGDTEIQPVSETFELKPKCFYANGKLASEFYLRTYSGFGIQVTSLRLFNVYGPGQNMANMRQGMISIYLSQVLKNNHIIVKGNGERFRDFIFIDDVVNAFCEILNRENTGYDCFNVGTGNSVTVKQVLDCIIKLHGEAITVEYTSGTPGDMHGIEADISKIVHETSWNPKTNFKQGIKMMYDFYLNKSD